MHEPLYDKTCKNRSQEILKQNRAANFTPLYLKIIVGLWVLGLILVAIIMLLGY